MVDCSGSMGGRSIKNASECLLVFLHSIPVGCKFNIILFGSNYKSIFGKDGLVEYNEESLKKAEEVAKNLEADMGGTNLFGPLLESYKQSEKLSKKGNIVQIFIITDGRIFDEDEVFKLVCKNRNKNRLFPVGIGSSADRDLVKNLASLSLGSFDIVSESDQITEKIVDLLHKSMSSTMTNISIFANDQESLEIIPNPMTPLYNGKLMNIYVRRTNKESKIENVMISGYIGDEIIEISIDQFKEISNSTAKKLFSFQAIKDYENLYDDIKRNGNNNQELDKIKNRIIELSIESQIISKFTSFVGVEAKPHKLKEQKNTKSSDVGVDMFTPGYVNPLSLGLLGDIMAIMSNLQSGIEDVNEQMEIEQNKFEQMEIKHRKFEQMEIESIRRQNSELRLEKDLDKRCDKCLLEKNESIRSLNSKQKCERDSDEMHDKKLQPENRIQSIHSGQKEISEAIHPNSVQIKADKSFSSIISSQDFDGKWKSSLFDHLINYIDEKRSIKAKEVIDEFISSLNIQDDQLGGDIKSTIAALCVLYLIFSDESAKWKLISLKTFGWLNSMHPENWETKIQDLVSQINFLNITIVIQFLNKLFKINII